MATPLDPPRRPVPAGGARRSTTFDLHLRAGEVRMLIDGRGRDVVADAGGHVTVVGGSGLRAVVHADGHIADIRTAPDVPGMAEWRVPAMQGFRARLRQAMPDSTTGLPLATLLDDVPVGVMITGYAEARDPAHKGRGVPSTGRPLDVCAGWRSGATIELSVRESGRLVAPPGRSVELTPRPEGAWHGEGPPPVRGIRRRRSLDVVPVDGDRLEARASLLDTYVESDGEETAIHEYDVVATIDLATWRIEATEVTRSALPLPECYDAGASAQAARGREVGTLRASLGADLRGPTACTHLTDLLRHLDDARPLVDHLSAAAGR